MTFVKTELKRIKKTLKTNYPECSESQKEDVVVLEDKDEEQMKRSREFFLKITLNFLKRMNQEELVDRLDNSKMISIKM